MNRLKVFLVVVILASWACGSPTDTNTTIIGAGTEAPAGATSEALPIGQVGDRVESGGIALTLNSVSTATRIDDLWTPDDGNVFVVVDVTVENVDRDSAAYNPLYFSIKDSDGFEYTTAIAAPDPTLKSGDLPLGDKTRGNVAFELKEGATGLVMSYEPLVLLGGYQEIRFNLGDASAP